jgi:hypothetical protein
MSQSPTEDGKPSLELTHLDESHRHELLADERRRVVLDVLAGRTVPLGLETAAKTVAEQESDTGDAAGETVQRVALSLHHHHLPKLRDFGVVDYDSERKRVESLRLD